MWQLSEKNVMVFIWTVIFIWVSFGNCHVNKPGSHLIFNSDNHQMRVNLEVQTELKILRFRYLQTWRLQALHFKVSESRHADKMQPFFKNDFFRDTTTMMDLTIDVGDGYWKQNNWSDLFGNQHPSTSKFETTLSHQHHLDKFFSVSRIFKN